MLPRINYYLTGCDFALSDLPAELPVPTRIENEFGISLKAFETEFARLQSVLTDTGLLARPAPAREFVYREKTSQYPSYNRKITSTGHG
jgi:hypothetical protein